MIHSFLAQLESGVDLVLGLEQVTMVRLNPDGRVILMHSLLSIWVNVYSTQRRLFAYLGKLPSEVLPPVVEIPDEAFAAQHTVCAVPRVDHVTHLGGISPLDWQTKPCKREVKSAGTEYVDLAFRGLKLAPTGLRVLASLEGGGRTPQRLRDVDRSVPPVNRLRASLRGGS